MFVLAWAMPFSSFAKLNFMRENKKFDVIIVGGSYAGLSAAMALGRSLRQVLIIDAGLPCNRQTPHSHNFITQDGRKPAEIAEKAKKQVLKYDTVGFLNGYVKRGLEVDGGFEVETSKGEKFRSKKLIFATGIKDLLPEIKGFAECWGISVIHCPYCHGYEFKNEKTAIMANGERAVHMASLIKNLTNDLTIFTSGKADFNEEQLAKLNRNGIKIIESTIVEIEHNKGQVKHVILENKEKIAFKAVYAAIPFSQHSDIPVAMGCGLTEHGHIKVDATQQTTVKGVYACGDGTTMMRSVANAVATGNAAGAMANNAITGEEF